MREEKIYIPSKFSQDWHHDNCYGCGSENEHGLHLNFPFEEETGEVLFRTKLPKQFEGAPGYSHGGILASILDEAQGVLCFHVGHFVMTDSLHIHYKKAVPLETEIEVRATMSSVRNRRLYTKATISNPQTKDIYTTSRARWYDMNEKVIRRMFQATSMEIELLLEVLEANKKRGKEIRKRIKQSKVN